MKMMKTKHFRRLAVFLAMVAPAVYLFGSLFSALTGSHGSEVFAEPVYEEQYVEIDDFGSDGSYRLVVDSVAPVLSSPDFRYIVFSCEFSYENVSYADFRFFTYGGLNIFQIYGSPSRDLGSYTIADGTLSEPFKPWTFFGGSSMSSFVTYIGSFGVSYSLAKLTNVPTAEIPENAGAYSDYVFKNFFAKDNFLVQWGENAISETPAGFAPFGAFWRYLDLNVLHLSNDQVGLMGYGYIYYACHVLLFDIGFILVTFFLDFIQRIADKFTGGE